MRSLGVLVGLALRRVRHRPAAVLAVALCTFVACLAAATAQVHADSADRAARTSALRQAPLDDRSVVVSGTVSRGLAETDAVVRSAASRIPGAQVSRWVTSSGYAVAGAAANLRVELGHAPGAVASSTLVSGAWPTSDGDVAVPQVAAERLGWRVGQTLALSRLVATQADPPRLRISGTYRTRATDTTGWADDARRGAGISEGDFRTVGPLLVSGDTVPALGAGATATWRIVPPADASGLEPPVRHAVAALEQAPLLDGFAVRTGLPATLERAVADGVRTRAAIAGPTALLVLVALVGLGLTGLLLGAVNERGDRLLRTRGASPGQVGVLAGLAAAAVLPAGVLAALLAPVLARVLPGADRVEPTVMTWVVALGATIAAMLVVTLTALAGSVGGHGRTSRMIDAVLLLLAALAWWRLRGAGDEQRADALSVVAPALVVLGLALVAMRLAPVLGRLVARAAGRSRGLAAAWAAWGTRHPSPESLGTRLLAVVTAAVAALTVTQLASNDQLIQDRAVREVPAPVVVTLAPDAGHAAEVARGLGGTTTSVWSEQVTGVGGAEATLLGVDLSDAVIADPTLVPDPAGARAQHDTWQSTLHGLRAAPAPPPVPAIPSTSSATTTSAPSATTSAAPSVQPTAPLSAGAPSPAGALTLEATVVGTLESLEDRSGLPELQLLLDDGEGYRHALALTAGTPSTQVSYRGTLGTGVGRAVPEPLELVSATMLYPPADMTLRSLTVRRPDGSRTSLLPAPVPLTTTTEGSRGLSAEAVVAKPRVDPVPAVLSRGLAEALEARPGQTVELPVAGRTVRLRVTRVVDRVPGQGDAQRAALVDLRTLQTTGARGSSGADLLLPPLEPGQVWGTRVPDPASAPQAGQGGVLTVATQAETLARLRSDVAPAALRGVLALLLTASAALAVVAGLAGTAAAARARQRDRAVLHALGVPAALLRRSVWGSELAQVLVAVLTGTAVGLLAAVVVIPAWSVEGAGTTPVVPWGQVVAAAGALAAALWLTGLLALRPPARSWSSLLREGDTA